MDSVTLDPDNQGPAGLLTLLLVSALTFWGWLGEGSGSPLVSDIQSDGGWGPSHLEVLSPAYRWLIWLLAEA